MRAVITTCEKCRARYSWDMDSQECPDCPECGFNAMKIIRAKREKCLSAAESGELEAVKKALGDPDVRKNLNAGPLTILHHAVSGNQKGVVEYLLGQGAEPNIAYPQSDKETPLHIAALKGYHDIARILMENGAMVDIANSYGSKPEDLAKDEDMRILLQPHVENIPLLEDFFKAIKTSDPDTVEEYLKGGADPNAKDPAKNSLGFVTNTPALCRAPENAAYGKEVAGLLIKYGADPNTRRNAEISALHDAVMKGRADIAELLIQNGADVNWQNDSKETPLHEAFETTTYIGSKKLEIEVVKVLLESGADVAAQNNRGYTPVKNAAFAVSSLGRKKNSGCPEYDFSVIELLLDAGGILEEDDIPSVWVTDKKAVPDPLFKAYLSAYIEKNPTSPVAAQEKKRRQEEEADRKKSVKEERRSSGCCVMCGKPLSFFQRMLGKESHGGCTSFQE